MGSSLNTFSAIFNAILGPIFGTCWCLFRSSTLPCQNTVFEGRPKRNRCFGVPRRLKNPPKAIPKQGPKTNPEKVLNNCDFGIHVGFIFWLLGRLLAPRVAQDRPKTSQDRPKTGQDRPKTDPRQAKDRPRQAKTSPRQAQDVTAESHCEKSNDANASAGGRSLLNI